MAPTIKWPGGEEVIFGKNFMIPIPTSSRLLARGRTEKGALNFCGTRLSRK